MSLFNRLRSRPGLNTALGVLFAVLAGLLLLGYFTRLMNEKGGGRPVEIPVAARNIETGSVIGREDISSMKIPSGYLVPGSRRRQSEVLGARALRSIARGEPFLESAVASRGDGTLAARIPLESRAYSIDMSDHPGAGPELRPGDRVDVLETSGDPPRTTTLLKARLVLQLDGKSDDTDAGSQATRLTLQVSPAEAEGLAQAETTGRLSISLCPLPEPGEGD